MILQTTEAGGRETPIASGYRAGVTIDGVTSTASVRLLAKDHAYPGETHDIELTFGNPELVDSLVRVGARFTFKEGLRVIGEGTIESVASSERTKRSIRELGGEIWAELGYRISDHELGWKTKERVVDILMGVLARYGDFDVENDEDLPVSPLDRFDPER